LRIDHFNARRTQAIDFGFAMKHQELAGLQAAFEVASVEKFAGERAAVVLHEKMIDGVAATHTANRLTAGDADAQSENIVGAHIFDLRKVETVFVSERQVAKEIFKCVNAAFGEELGALRAYTFDHLDVGLQAIGHKGSYSRETMASTKAAVKRCGERAKPARLEGQTSVAFA
jgi:hypothetical protein